MAPCIVPLHSNYIPVTIASKDVFSLLDTGSQVSFISPALFQTLKDSLTIEMMHSQYSQAVGVGNEKHAILGATTLQIQLADAQFEHTFHILQGVKYNMILGLDFIKMHNLIIDHKHDTVHIHKELAIKFVQPSIPIAIVRPSEEIVIPPLSEMNIPVRLSRDTTDPVLIEPSQHVIPAICIAKTLVQPFHARCVTRIMNASNQPITLKRSTVIALAHKVDPAHIAPLNMPLTPPTQAANSPVTEVNVTEVSPEKQCPYPPIPDEHYLRAAAELNIDLSNSCLTEAQKRQLLILIGKYRDCFAITLKELGRAKVKPYVLNTGDHPPVSHRFYRTTPQNKRELESQINEMLECGLLEPSESEWSSPCCLVRRADGQARLCVDYRSVNKALVTKTSWPLPRISDSLDIISAQHSTVFSLIDCRRGYWQIPLCPSTAEKTTFTCHLGNFSYNSLPFGLRDSTAIYQHCMANVFRGLNWKKLLVYVDDILLFEESPEKMLLLLEEVFNRLKEFNFKMAPAKCVFCVPSIVFLGFKISGQGITGTEQKTEAMRNYPTPRNAKEVKRFLGCVGYYRKLVPNFAKIAAPLYGLLKHDTKFLWLPLHDEAFHTLRTKLIEPPILAFADTEKPFIIHVDASIEGIGYILSQEDEQGQLHPIEFGSKALLPQQQRWSTTEQECYALITAVSEWYCYIANQHTTVYTDHMPLTYLHTLKLSTRGRLSRWAMLLAPLNLSIRHKKGSENVVADALSRSPIKSSPSPASVKTDKSTHPLLHPPAIMSNHACNEDMPDICLLNVTENSTPVELIFDLPSQNITPDCLPIDISTASQPDNQNTADDRQHTPSLAHTNLAFSSTIDMEALQQADPELSPYINYMLHDILPPDYKTREFIKANSNQFVIEDKLLYHLWQPRTQGGQHKIPIRKQLALPATLREEVLQHYHDSLCPGGHAGFDRTYHTISERFWWPKMYTQVEIYTRTCLTCQEVKRRYHARPVPLQPLPIGSNFSQVHMDILCGLPTTTKNHKYILLLVCAFSKWPIALPLVTQEASEIAFAIYEHLITVFGVPSSICSDNARNFCSKLIDALCELMHIRRIRTASFHPEANSVAERRNSNLIQSIRTYAHDSNDWHEKLPGICMGYRASPSTRSTGLSPYFMLFGKNMPGFVDVSLTPKPNLPKSVKQHVLNLTDNLQMAQEIATHNTKLAQQAYKTYYDRKARKQEYYVTQKVWLYCSHVPLGKKGKSLRFWRGPYYVTSPAINNCYHLRDAKTHKLLPKRINIARLKPFHCPSERPVFPPLEYQEFEGDLDGDQYDPQATLCEDTLSITQTDQGEDPFRDLPLTQTDKDDTTTNDSSQPTQQANTEGTTQVQQTQPALPLTQTDKTTDKTKLATTDTDEQTDHASKWHTAERIIKCARFRGSRWYKVKFATKDYQWCQAADVSDLMKRQFHASHTHTGRKRKRPTKASKYFTTNPPPTATQPCNDTTSSPLPSP